MPYESYTHLTREQRYHIARGLWEGHTQQVIADIIGVHKSTISREVRRNRSVRRAARLAGYQPRIAHNLALARRTDKGKVRIGRENK